MATPDLTISVGVSRRSFLGSMGKAGAAGLLLGAGGLDAFLAACGATGGGKATATGGIQSTSIRAVADLESNLESSGELLQFQKYIEQESGGKIKVNYFSYEELDSSFPTVVTQVISGQIQMSQVISTFLVTAYPALQVISLPFLFKDSAQFNSVMSGDLAAEIAASTQAATGLRLSAWSSFGGFVQLLAKDHPITSPSDVKGEKIRIQAAGVLGDTMTALGATGVVLNIAELYTSLGTGVVTGAAINDNTVLNYKLEPVLPYFSVSNLTPEAGTIIMNGAWYDSLDSATQKLIDSAVQKAVTYNNSSLVPGLESQEYSQLQKAGVKINSVSSTELSNFRDTVQPIWSGIGQYGANATAWLKKIKQATA